MVIVKDTKIYYKNDVKLTSIDGYSISLIVTTHSRDNKVELKKAICKELGGIIFRDNRIGFTNFQCFNELPISDRTEKKLLAFVNSKHSTEIDDEIFEYLFGGNND